MKLEAVCTEKVLMIGFTRFPARLRSIEAHDKLNDILVEVIPEITRDGLDGGMYRQMMCVWITIECEDMDEGREAWIRDEFVRLLKEFCKLK